MDLNNILETFQKFGAAAGLHHAARRTINRIVPHLILRTVKLTLEGVDPQYFETPSGLVARFLERDELHQWAGDPRLDMDVPFINESLSKGDRCYGVLDGDELVSYGWYARRPTLISHDLCLHFDPRYVYMFKGYTLPDYRGRRLHAVGMARALEEYSRLAEVRCRGVLSYVESDNFMSLRSCYRMGYEDIGVIVVARALGQAFTFASPGSRAYGMRIEVMKEHPAAIAATA